MKKRILIRLTLLVVLALVGLVVPLCLPSPNHEINREAAQRITVGMSREEVERIVKCPPGDYSSALGDVQQFRDLQDFFDNLTRFDASHTCAFWATDEFALCVHFDGDNAVTNSRFWVRQYGFRARLGRLLSSLGLIR